MAMKKTILLIILWFGVHERVLAQVDTSSVIFRGTSQAISGDHMGAVDGFYRYNYGRETLRTRTNSVFFFIGSTTAPYTIVFVHNYPTKNERTTIPPITDNEADIDRYDVEIIDIATYFANKTKAEIDQWKLAYQHREKWIIDSNDTANGVVTLWPVRLLEEIFPTGEMIISNE